MPSLKQGIRGCYDEFGRTRAEAITNVYVAFQQAFSGEVLAEHAPREFCAGQFCAPKRVVLRRVGIHRLVTPAVDGKVGLPIAFYVQRRHASPSCYGRLEDRRDRKSTRLNSSH